MKSSPEDAYTWKAVGIASPPFCATEEAFGEVRRLIGHLQTKFRVMVNDSCGLHLDVGSGAQGFDTDVLKRLMADPWT